MDKQTALQPREEQKDPQPMEEQKNGAPAIDRHDLNRQRLADEEHEKISINCALMPPQTSRPAGQEARSTTSASPAISPRTTCR